ncbi:putative transcriptional regulator [Bradyrhizobium sp. USDA 4474]
MSASVSPKPLNATKASVWSYAERVAHALNFKAADPVEPVVARLGGRIEYKNPSFRDVGLPESIVVRSRNDFTIFLPSMTSSVRDRFTVAHELGHFFLHYPRAAEEAPGVPMVATRWVDENDREQQRAEWEANWFAAAFLMPAQMFIETMTRFKQVERAAQIFAVSVQAAEVRAKSLGW